ncbi:MAG: hypothetical protein CMJ32_06970 [Phycisphaerae bacterium]|nr:hypothetical protein [Phycisphaerae bacterium]
MPLLEDLRSLQTVDSQVRGLRGRLDSATTYLNVQVRKINELGSLDEELQGQIKQLQASIANLEGESKDKNDRIEKLREELNNSQTTKEYKAVLSEMQTSQESRDEIDQQTLTLIDELERLKVRLEEIAQQKVEREKVRMVAEQELQQRKNDVGERLEQLEIERETAARSIPDKKLELFDRIADAYDGEVMAEIEEISKRHKEYSCSSCNMELPFNLVVQLVSMDADAVQCPACDRILCMPEETRAALAK